MHCSHVATDPFRSQGVLSTGRDGLGMASHARPSRAASSVPIAPALQRLVRPEDVVGFLGANAVLIVLMWIRHGGVDQLGTVAGIATATGQVTALLGTYLAMLQLLLMSRAPVLDRLFGRDKLTLAHRWIGFGTVWLLVAHGIFTTIGFAMADGQSVFGEAWTLITTWEFVLMATVSLGLFIAVAVTSIRLARKRISYESWYGIHLYAYLAVALGFAHQLVVGSDFIDDPLARIYWVGLYVVTIGCLLAFRFAAPILVNVRHRFRVANVVTEAPGVVSVYLTGRDLDRFTIRAGQYVVVRFLAGGWWRAHPYSISAEPNGRWIRFTVKALGDDSARLDRLTIGTRVIVEGPYGNLTTDVRSSPSVLLVAAGIGITPLRALLEELSALVAGDPLVSRPNDGRPRLPARAGRPRRRPSRGRALPRRSTPEPGPCRRPARCRGDPGHGPRRRRPRGLPVRPRRDDANGGCDGRRPGRAQGAHPPGAVR